MMTRQKSLELTAGLLATGLLLAPGFIAAGAVQPPRPILQITVAAPRGGLPGRYSHLFGDGGFCYPMDEGVHYTNAHYQHANTETIMGHVSLATGTAPGLAREAWLFGLPLVMFEKQIDYGTCVQRPEPTPGLAARAAERLSVHRPFLRPLTAGDRRQLRHAGRRSCGLTQRSPDGHRGVSLHLAGLVHTVKQGATRAGKRASPTEMLFCCHPGENQHGKREARFPLSLIPDAFHASTMVGPAAAQETL